MAIRPTDEYAGQTTTGDPGYPHGKAKNVGVTGDGTGTPLEEAWVNDLFGFEQALLDRAGITPSGSADAVGASQYLDALTTWLGGARNLARNPYQPMGGIPTGRSFSPVPQVGTGLSCASMSLDGTKLYCTDLDFGVTFQYTMSVLFDETTAIYSGLSGAYGNQVWDIFWKPDGTRVYTADAGVNYVQQIDLTTPWTVTPSAPAGTLSIATEEVTVRALCLSADGATLWVGGAANDAVFEYTLSTPWDVTTGVVTAWGWPFGANVDGIEVNAAGTRMYVMSGSTLYELGMNGNTLQNAVLIGSQPFSVNPVAGMASIRFVGGGDKLIVANTVSDSVLSYHSSIVTSA
jgi:DNA-binding beta-propeller fold protein YncE